MGPSPWSSFAAGTAVLEFGLTVTAVVAVALAGDDEGCAFVVPASGVDLEHAPRNSAAVSTRGREIMTWVSFG